jgi:hypothetical protein
MAIAAGENAIDQIIAALEQIGVGPRAASAKTNGAMMRSKAVPLAANIHVISTAAIQCNAKPIAQIAAVIAA